MKYEIFFGKSFLACVLNFLGEVSYTALDEHLFVSRTILEFLAILD